MKVLITGVYGIVGSYLCEKLKKDHEIIGIGRKKEYYGCDKYYCCDITDKDSIREIVLDNKDLDIIIHCAALAHNKGNDLSKNRFMKVNYEATKCLADLSNKYLKLKNFIFISTISVYGEKLDKNLYIETDECVPKSPYAVAKRLSEEYIIENYNSNYTILRLAPVYSKGFTLNIYRRSKIKGIPYRVGSGKQKLSLCNIENIYLAVNYIINNTENEVNEIYNVSDSYIYEFNNLLKAIGAKYKVILPSLGLKILYRMNNLILKKQFIYENSIKLLSDNIYSCDKLDKKVKMRFSLEGIK